MTIHISITKSLTKVVIHEKNMCNAAMNKGNLKSHQSSSNATRLATARIGQPPRESYHGNPHVNPAFLEAISPISPIYWGFKTFIFPWVLGSKGNWWLNHPSEKYAQVKLDHLLRDRGENKESLKPPPSKVFFTSFTATYLTCKTVIIPGKNRV